MTPKERYRIYWGETKAYFAACNEPAKERVQDLPYSTTKDLTTNLKHQVYTIHQQP